MSNMFRNRYDINIKIKESQIIFLSKCKYCGCDIEIYFINKLGADISLQKDSRWYCDSCSISYIIGDIDINENK